MSSFRNEIEPFKLAALAELKAAPDLAALEHAKGEWIGAHGKFTALMKQLGSLPKEDRPAAGKLINQAKAELEAALASRREELELKAALPKEPADFTLPGRRRALGKLHPLTQVTDDIVRSFRKIGFVVADGPEIEDEYHCFDALNTPADHPARDTQDTFYLKTSNRLLLREEVKVRFRPHYFSYTEPSFEIDFSSALVRKMGKQWLEIAGCGMVHPQVFENVGYDPEIWTGWAFGFGIERIAMIRYGINDIRLFYENDMRFLKQF